MPARPLRSDGVAELVTSLVFRLFLTKDLKQFQCVIEMKVRQGYIGHDPSEHHNRQHHRIANHAAESGGGAVSALLLDPAFRLLSQPDEKVQDLCQMPTMIRRV